MNVLGRIFLNSRKDRRKDVKTERRKDGVFLWVVEELTFLINRFTPYFVLNIQLYNCFLMHITKKCSLQWNFAHMKLITNFLK